MAGPAIIMFFQAQQLVYRRAVDCGAIVWWLRGAPGCLPHPTPPCIQVRGQQPLVMSPGVPLAWMLRGAADSYN